MTELSSTAPGLCDNLLHADCGSNATLASMAACTACIEQYRPNLQRAGCQAPTLAAYCKKNVAPPPPEGKVRDPTAWTILQQDGPNHLGLW